MTKELLMGEMDTRCELFKKTPIETTYAQPASDLIRSLKTNDHAVEIKSSQFLSIENSYLKQGISGALPSIYLRAGVELTRFGGRVEALGFTPQPDACVRIA